MQFHQKKKITLKLGWGIPLTLSSTLWRYIDILSECLLCAGTVLVNEQNRQNSSSAHTNASWYLSLFFLSLKWKYNALNWENALCGGRWRENILEYNAKFKTLAGNLTPFCRNVWTSILSDNGRVNAVHYGYKTLKSKISQMIHFKAQCGLVRALNLS